MGMYGTTVQPPPPRDYGQETTDTLEAQIRLAPQLYASEMNQSYGRPAYARAEQNMLWDSLVGYQGGQGATGAYPTAPVTGGTTAQPATVQDAISGLFGRQQPTGAKGGAFSFGSGVGTFPAGQQTTGVEGGVHPWVQGPGPGMIATGGDQQEGRGGLLELYEEHIAPSLIRQQRTAAMGEIDMLRELGPEFLAAQRAADPMSEMLRQGLQRKAQEGLDAGQGLTKEELAGITESVRSGQSARGVAYQRSQPSMIEETMARMGAGRQAEAARIQRAAGILGQTGQVDPFLALTGRSGGIGGQVMNQMGGAGFALQSGPQLFNPESQYAGALASGNQANIMNARMATAANKAAITGSLISAVGSIGGGFAGRPPAKK